MEGVDIARCTWGTGDTKEQAAYRHSVSPRGDAGQYPFCSPSRLITQSATVKDAFNLDAFCKLRSTKSTSFTRLSSEKLTKRNDRLVETLPPSIYFLVDWPSSVPRRPTQFLGSEPRGEPILCGGDSCDFIDARRSLDPERNTDGRCEFFFRSYIPRTHVRFATIA